MKEIRFQEAIEKVLTDESYASSLGGDPDKLIRDFALEEKQIFALKPTDTPGMQNGFVRPTCFCCCTCVVAKRETTDA